jgi:high-affinity nickel-transport protein
MRSKLVILYALLVGGNLFAWVWALFALHDYPMLLGTAVLATLSDFATLSMRITSSP